MWLLLALVAGVFYTISSLLTRYLLKGDKDSWAFSFYFSLVGALTAFPFMLKEPQLSSNWKLWVVMFIVGGLIVLQNYLNFKSSNYLEASLQGSVTKLRLLWVLIIGILFFQESTSALKITGTLLTIAAGLVVYFKSLEAKSKTALYFALLATLFYGFVIGLYKVLFQEFNSSTLTFFIFAIPAGINLAIMPNSLHRVMKMGLTQGKTVFIATFFGGLANLAMNEALVQGEASNVLVIIEAFLIVVLLGEHIYLKEKKDFWRKLIAVLLATAGAILVRV